MIASVGAPPHLSKTGRKLVAAGFVAFIVIAVLFVFWLKAYRDEE